MIESGIDQSINGCAQNHHHHHPHPSADVFSLQDYFQANPGSSMGSDPRLGRDEATVM